MSDKYLVISSDCHAGLPADQYREYVDPKFRDTYDEFVAEAESMRNARMGPSEDRATPGSRSGARRSRTTAASAARGTPTSATRSSTATASPAR